MRTPDGKLLIKNKIHVRNSIWAYNGHHAQIRLDPNYMSRIIFTLHPNDRNALKSKLHDEFLEVFKGLAK